MPTGHVSSVNQDPLFLIAAILDGSPLNVGQIIAAQIRHCAARTAGEMFFPSLITFMCQRLGLPAAARQSVPYVAGTITMVDLRRLLPTNDSVPAAPPIGPASSDSASAKASSVSASESSSRTQPAALSDADSDSVSDYAAPPESPIDVSDTAMPDVSPSTASTPPRRSNRVRARIVSPSSHKASSSR